MSESMPEAIQRVAKAAGYLPKSVTAYANPNPSRDYNAVQLTFDHPTYVAGVHTLTFGQKPSYTDEEILNALKRLAGPLNQPQPVIEVAGVQVLADKHIPVGEMRIYSGNSRVPYLIPIDYATLEDALAKSLAGPPLIGLVPKQPDYRNEMVSAVIAEQVKAGGVDTEGSRSQAERWCAMLADCVCVGLRMTTEAGRLKLARRDGADVLMRNGPLGARWRKGIKAGSGPLGVPQ